MEIPIRYHEAQEGLRYKTENSNHETLINHRFVVIPDTGEGGDMCIKKGCSCIKRGHTQVCQSTFKNGY